MVLKYFRCQMGRK